MESFIGIDIILRQHKSLVFDPLSQEIVTSEELCPSGWGRVKAFSPRGWFIVKCDQCHLVCEFYRKFIERVIAGEVEYDD